VTDRTTTWTVPQIWAGRVAILVAFFSLWEQVAARKLIDPILIGRPSGIVTFLWQEIFVTGSLIKDLGWTMLGTILAFLLGSVCGVLVGMVTLALFLPWLDFPRAFEPMLTAASGKPWMFTNWAPDLIALTVDRVLDPSTVDDPSALHETVRSWAKLVTRLIFAA